MSVKRQSMSTSTKFPGISWLFRYDFYLFLLIFLNIFIILIYKLSSMYVTGNTKVLSLFSL